MIMRVLPMMILVALAGLAVISTVIVEADKVAAHGPSASNGINSGGTCNV